MSDNHEYLGTNTPKFRLTADVTMLMVKGAGYALVFCLAVWFSIWALAAVRHLLPAESQEADDPTPFSMVIPAPETVQRV